MLPGTECSPGVPFPVQDRAAAGISVHFHPVL